MGNYTQARQLRNVATESISSVISQVLYPDFANNQNDEKLLSSRLNFSVSVISYYVVALMLICILVANPLINLLYGDKWMVCVPYFKILCLAGLFAALQDVNINIIAAKGKSKLLFYINLLKLLVFVILMIGGAKIGGFIGMIWGMSFYTFLAWLLFAILSSNILHGKIWGQLCIVLHSILLASIPFVIVEVLKYFINYSFPNVIDIFIQATLFVLVYYIVSLITKSPILFFTNQTIRNKLSGK